MYTVHKHTTDKGDKNPSKKTTKKLCEQIRILNVATKVKCNAMRVPQ